MSQRTTALRNARLLPTKSPRWKSASHRQRKPLPLLLLNETSLVHSLRKSRKGEQVGSGRDGLALGQTTTKGGWRRRTDPGTVPRDLRSEETRRRRGRRTRTSSSLRRTKPDRAQREASPRTRFEGSNPEILLSLSFCTYLP